MSSYGAPSVVLEDTTNTHQEDSIGNYACVGGIYV